MNGDDQSERAIVAGGFRLLLPIALSIFEQLLQRWLRRRSG